MGIDRNAPKWERRDLVDDEWWNRWEPLLYGPGRVHDLRDAWRDVLDRDPELLKAILAERPEGPLAVTHVRRGIECRTTRSTSHPNSRCSRSNTSGTRPAKPEATMRLSGRFSLPEVQRNSTKDRLLVERVV